MGLWPYGFPTLTDQENHLRRQALDSYARIAHYSALAPPLLFLLYRLTRHVLHRTVCAPAPEDRQGRYAHIPASPTAKEHRRSTAGRLTAQWRKLAWRLGDDVYFAGSRWGQWDEWLVGALWTTWLLVLSVTGTGNDYFHLTKRLGLVAASQLPTQHLLASKVLNPFAWAFKSSHERLNRYHRVLGRIIYGLVLAHLVLYNGYFLYAGIWLARVLHPIVFSGLVASLGLHALFATSTRAVRHFSYRLFFITHLSVTLVLPLLLILHASSALIYIVEIAVITLADVAVHRLTIVRAPSTLEAIPGTTLVKVTSCIPSPKLASFRAAPGSHICVSILSSSRTTAALPSSKSGALIDLYLLNPFTVATVDEQHSTITFVARIRSGPMTKFLSDSSSASASESPTDPRKTILGIQGPHGTMTTQFNRLLDWAPNRVLLISGGIGATFTLPIYHALQTQSEVPPAKLQLIWAVRHAADATWAVTDAATGKSVLEDPNIQLFLTGDMGMADGHHGQDVADVELTPWLTSNNPRAASQPNHRRPDIEKIVDDVFRRNLDESVAIIVCGPIDMTREVRHRVGPWARKGRKIWWHSETFGW